MNDAKGWSVDLVVSDMAGTTMGDTVLDLQAGRNAGVAFNIAVLSGAHDRERLEREPHAHRVGSIVDVPALSGCTPVTTAAAQARARRRRRR